ncbi:Uncharacterised protein [Cedecea neteri]|uniref:Putative tail fiber protein gp53-like C-terminal domain-containing protein n=1 Tax=Cedecea neteri TaxID=158822 RepID=A0A2X3KYM2_9ENTR|nr:Uncharacterised protein [Cedecea neteri]
MGKFARAVKRFLPAVKASSAQVNKALRQTSFIAAALAQFVSDKSGQDVLDDGDIAAFLAKLTTGFGKQYLSRQNPFADIKADGAAAVSSALTNLGLGEAAKRGVGTGEGQLPDMASFTSDLRGIGIQRLPGGLIFQWGAAGPDGTGLSTINYPIAFSQRPFFVTFGYRQSSNPSTMQSIVINDQILNNIGFQARWFTE